MLGFALSAELAGDTTWIFDVSPAFDECPVGCAFGLHVLGDGALADVRSLKLDGLEQLSTPRRAAAYWNGMYPEKLEARKTIEVTLRGQFALRVTVHIVVIQ